MAAPPPAPAAPPAKRKSARGAAIIPEPAAAGAPGPAAAAAIDPAADRRLSADSKKALHASRLEAFERFKSTAGLWAWGADYAGWSTPADAPRDEIIGALMKMNAESDVPPSQGAPFT